MHFFGKNRRWILILVLFFSPLFLYAQFVDLYSERDIFAEIYPEIPGPQESVHMKLKSYVLNLNNYYIAWFLNGNKVKEGFGERELNFTTGKTGELTEVKALIELAGGKIVQKTYRFVPATVDILWEALDSYTPPFYRGKALPLPQGKVKVLGLPETELLEPQDSPNLVYYWKRNGKNVIAHSGFGKNAYVFTLDPIAKKEEISLRVNDRRENSFAENTIVIPNDRFKGRILFYEIRDGRILTNRALNRFSAVNGDSIRLSFHPLFMSTTAPNFVDLFVDWSVNGEKRPPQSFKQQDELAITTDGKAGIVEIGLHLEGIDNLFQSLDENVDLQFFPSKT